MIARGIGGGMQLGTLGAQFALDVVAGGHAIGVEVLGGLQQVLEFHPLIAADAGHGGGAGQIAVGKFVDHGVFENVLIIQHVMREAHILGHAAGIVDVDASATGAFFGQRRAVIVKLQGDADHIIAFFRKHGGHDRAVDAAGHGDDDTGVGRGLGKAERVERLIEGHGGSHG